MRRVAFFSMAFAVLGICLVVASEDPAPADAQKAAPPAKKVAPQPDPDNKEATKPKAAQPAATGKDAAKQDSDVPDKYTNEETAIRERHESLLKAYAADDAKAVGTHFTEDAEYVNADGGFFHGRSAIEDSLTEFFSDHPGCKLESELDAIRFVSSTVAIVEGVTTVTHKEDESNTQCKFTAVYNKDGEQWLLASIRDQLHRNPPARHEDQLEQLNWLVGEWIDEDDDSVVSFSCYPTDNGKFLLREFTLKVAGQEVLKGTQRIGWDPVSEQFRTWIFDSEGGFGEGVWIQDGDSWLLNVVGVNSDGEVASGTSVYSNMTGRSMTWQAVDHEVGGVPVPDSSEFSLVQRSPPPADLDETPAKADQNEKPAKAEDTKKPSNADKNEKPAKND